MITLDTSQLGELVGRLMLPYYEEARFFIEQANTVNMNLIWQCYMR